MKFTIGSSPRRRTFHFQNMQYDSLQSPSPRLGHSRRAYGNQKYSFHEFLNATYSILYLHHLKDWSIFCGRKYIRNNINEYHTKNQSYFAPNHHLRDVVVVNRRSLSTTNLSALKKSMPMKTSRKMTTHEKTIFVLGKCCFLPKKKSRVGF